MSLCVWDPKFSVGIEDIDNQHKRLIEYVNELDEASRTHDTGYLSCLSTS